MLTINDKTILKHINIRNVGLNEMRPTYLQMYTNID